LGTDDGSRVGGLRVTGFGLLGTPTSGGKRNRFIGQVSYRSKMLTLAGEYGAIQDSVTAPASAKVNRTELSAFGVLRLTGSPVAIIGRVDIVDPNTASASTNDKRTTIIGGLSYQLSPNVRLLADVDRTSFQTPSGGTAPKAIMQALFQTQYTF
ncbi:MAG TPA: hypothetical protein VEH31_00615, partial [Streptosporangiaceae bacterium]|nr:hypothetical protein [Streptosporangiaceae bacterium]